MTPPLCVDLYCGLGGWSEGFLAEGYHCRGYDIEAHDYGQGGYPGELILRDVRSMHGSECKDAAVIVGSSPCQEFSYRAMPWSRAKALPPPYLGIELFNAQFRIQREACEAAGRYIPLVVENVRGAQKWVGRARWHYGSFYLWGDVPALMPMTFDKAKMPGYNLSGDPDKKWGAHTTGGYENAMAQIDHLKWGDCNGKRFDQCPKGNVAAHREETKVAGMNWSDRSRPSQGFNVIAALRYREGIKQTGISGVRENGKGDKWFQDGAARHGSKSNSRKAASAQIAKIPFPLAQWIARSYKPQSPLL